MNESLEKAIYRVMRAWKSANSQFAVYAANGKVCVSQQGTSLHEKRLKVHGANIIGVYDVDSELKMIIDDVEYFYKNQIAVPVPVAKIIKNDEPVFRSSGRRNK